MYLQHPDYNCSYQKEYLETYDAFCGLAKDLGLLSIERYVEFPRGRDTKKIVLRTKKRYDMVFKGTQSRDFVKITNENVPGGNSVWEEAVPVPV